METLIHIAITLGVIGAICLIVWAVETHGNCNHFNNDDDDSRG
jgi:hypothetical protein